MFKTQIPLTFAQHRDLRVFESNDYSYAKGETLAPLVLDELGDIAREYPIIFPDNQSDLPSALLGLEPGKNAYVADDGRWLATYIPSSIRRYPFLFGSVEQPEGEQKRMLVFFDPDAPHLKNPSGHPVFTPEGELTPHMQRRMQFLENLQKKIPKTRAAVVALAASGVLAERSIVIRKSDGQRHQIKGLRVVDEKKFNELTDADFNALRRSGALTLLYAHLLSWANFRQGPIGGKYPDLAAKAGGNNAPFQFESDVLDLSHLS
ncbi:SapC family protein [Chelatococcus asaccharovorans]|uniref:SapC family protein n=1 Tax=Chelatococcus asaccharovorans TaxID=28210 RepID=UPI00224C7671|nr:SapC family protein [Chelatococcus asaccharovorans]CAH1673208.1 SapC protein [Chelatococcus asaccharovorans]CAH1675370.1 SapC protein [Chelatococcus asaccharovorans]